MWWIDVFSTYLYGLKALVLVLGVLMLVNAVDDLFIDAVYWTRRAWRALVVYRRHDRLDHRALHAPPERPFAIMVPAWQETGVVGRMAELAAKTLDYENYHVFVGTYPNDPDTQRDVDEACARFRNVHKVVCARPGPTSKADCLNNVLDAILTFERRAGLQFAGFVLHDAEDVIASLELRLFNYLVERKDLIQLPVYPFPRRWYDFTSGHYMDEFAELHGKDVLVREALAGQVPSAGVGTCFSRRAVMALLADGDGIAFDVQSLTEDYDIGFRLKARGMSEVFVRVPVLDGRPAPRRVPVIGRSPVDTGLICVREYFPATVTAAVRQKSRWIVGIVYQGFRTHGWTRSLTLNYFLWRDRKGGLNNFVVFLATLIFLQLSALWVYQVAVPDSYRFLSIFEGQRWLTTLLAANFVFMVNRIVQRAWFVSRFYGPLQGMLSVLRLIWANVINFLANWRALVQIVRHGGVRRVAWDKTSHDFPLLGEASRARRPLGDILVAQGAITREQLEHALTHRTAGLRLGSWLVHQGVITGQQLAAAVAAQAGLSWEDADALAIDERIIRLVPRKIALHYAVLPLRRAGTTIVLATEHPLDPVTLAALGRKLARPVAQVIVPKGQVTVGLRYWHSRRTAESGRRLLDEAVAQGRLTAAQADTLWTQFVSRQVLFAEILLSLGHLDEAALGAVLLRHERSSERLGRFLVSEGIVSAAALEDALRLQETLQGSLRGLLGGTPPPGPLAEAV